LTDVATPALVLDRSKLARNCDRMLARCRDLGVRLRPHMKTLKSIDAARLAIDPVHQAIAVSTLREAEYFADHGVDDIQYAVCISPDKLARAAALVGRTRRFGVFLDNPDTARAVAAWSTGGRPAPEIWIEIDSGEHRTGLAPGDPRLIETATVLAAAGVTIAGVATHGGHSYRERHPDGIARIAEQERLAVTRAAETLRSAGFEIAGVSAGSTPTAVHGRSGEGLTEIRAGVYMAGDLFQAGIGSLVEDDIAVSVLATVISHDPSRNRMIVDVGGLALSKDRATAALGAGDLGYGLVTDLDGRAAFGRLAVAGVHQEHGEIVGEEPLPFERLAIGTRVRILPNHVCMTASAYDRMIVVAASRRVEGEWERVTGW
jgi:D-serine deaminase-like pyridoxal phosphate-dependent protein